MATATLDELVTFSGASLAGQAVRQILVHQSGYQDNVANNTTATLSHNLGYVPMFFAFGRQNGTSAYESQFTYYVVNPDTTVTITYQVNVTSTQISFTNNMGNAQDVAYVLFKDPF